MEWIDTTVGEFCPFVYGKAIKKSDQISEGMPVFGSNGVYAFSEKPLVDSHGVIIGRKGSVGKIHLSEEAFWVSDTAYYTNKATLADTYFVYYLLSSLGLENMNTDAAVPGLNRSNAHRLEIKVPKYASDREQLIAPLMKLDNKIQLNHRINQTLEQMAQALFKSWFVDFEPVKAKIAALEAGGSDEDALLAAMKAVSGKTADQLATLSTEQPKRYAELRATAELFPSAMQDSELGEIPEGWETGCIGNIAKATGGYAFKSKQFETCGHPVVKIKNIVGNGTVDLTDCARINSTVAESARNFQINDGDLVMAMTGATVGKTGLVLTHGRTVLLNQRVAVFKSDTFGSKVSWFLFCLFRRKEVFDSVIGAAQGSAQPNISSRGIEATPIVVPPSNVIHQFLSVVDAFFSAWLENSTQSKTLSELRDTLLPKLLSGELTLPDVDEAQTEPQDVAHV